MIFYIIDYRAMHHFCCCAMHVEKITALKQVKPALDGNLFSLAGIIVATGFINYVRPYCWGALYVFWLWIIIRQFVADSHCGYDFPYNPVKLILFYHGAVYHDFTMRVLRELLRRIFIPFDK